MSIPRKGDGVKRAIRRRGDKLYAHSREVAGGIQFVQFVTLSMIKYMCQRMDKRMQALDIPRILKSMKSLNATQVRSELYINEIPKKCHNIYGAFDLQLLKSSGPGTI